MNTQLDSFPLTALDHLGQRLLPGQARRVGHGIGELTVLAGRIWITGHGSDGDDEVLGPGQRVRLVDAGRVVIESFDGGAPAQVAWRPRRAAQRFFWRDFGALFAALARRAAPSASRAQGCMP